MTEHQKRVRIVEICVHKDKINWPREIKIVKKLMLTYPDPMIFEMTGVENLPTLAYFLTPDGKEKLQEAEKRLNMNLEFKVETHEVGENKVGEDAQINQKPKTVFDFIKKYEL